MLPTNQSRSLREFVTTMPASQVARDALERFQQTGTYRPEDLRRILGDPTAGVEYGTGVVHRWLQPGMIRS